MEKDRIDSDKYADLRQRAEALLQQEPREVSDIPVEDMQRLVHELQVHQIELEVQNEELRRAQEALEASRARYFDLYDLAPVGYLTISDVGLILEANLTAATLLGVARGALAKQPLTRFVFPEDQEIYYRHRKQLFETGTPQACEMRMVRQGNSPFWARLEVILAQDKESGAPVCRTVIGDITERKQAEEERELLLAQVREQSQRVQGIIDTVAQGVLLLDADGRVLLANPAAQDALALLARTRHGSPLTHLGDRPLAALLAPPPLGLWHEVQAGPRTFEVLARSIRDGSESERWVLVLSDATQEREVRARLEQQERLAAIGQLAAGFAHDFNNLMAAIALSGQMLQKNPNLSDRDRRYLAIIPDRISHATKLIGQILDFGRRSYMDRVPLDLLPLVKKLLKLLERTLPEDIRLELTSDRDEYIVHGDPARLQQALMNLAANARDAMPDGGRLQFALSGLAVELDALPPLPGMVAGDWVCLSVSDNGGGIAAEHLPRLFEPFFTTKEPDQGTGLGLSQVYGIVRQHDGYIAMHSRPGAGATFHIYLPLFTVPVLEAELLPVAKAAPGGMATILLVEDEPLVRLVVAEALADLSYRVLPASSGAEAMAILEQRQAIDLLLTNLVLPGLNGLDLYRALRQQQPAVRGLIMAGYTLAGAGHEVFQQEGADWIQKPFDMDDLAAKIRAVLAETVPPVSRARWRRDNR
jgi:two-component system cell cycle sensor histidine kinase/response regulator CckA